MSPCASRFSIQKFWARVKSLIFSSQRKHTHISLVCDPFFIECQMIRNRRNGEIAGFARTRLITFLLHADWLAEIYLIQNSWFTTLANQVMEDRDDPSNLNFSILSIRVVNSFGILWKKTRTVSWGKSYREWLSHTSNGMVRNMWPITAFPLCG